MSRFLFVAPTLLTSYALLVPYGVLHVVGYDHFLKPYSNWIFGFLFYFGSNTSVSLVQATWALEG